DLFKRLVADADVLIENFRTGTLEKWGIGWDVLSALNPRLVMVRVTGFGQTGPYRHRAGFGTPAEAMGGFAHITGQPDGPPPPRRLRHARRGDERLRTHHRRAGRAADPAAFRPRRRHRRQLRGIRDDVRALRA